MSMLRHRMLSGGDLHPYYRAVLMSAVVAGYSLPSARVQALQNKLVKEMDLYGLWGVLSGFWNFLHDASDNNFGRINWIQPAATHATLGSSDWASLAGVGNGGGVINTNFGLGNFIHSETFTTLSACIYNKALITNTGEDLLDWLPTNSRRIRIFARATPRTDVYPLVSAAGPMVAQAGNTAANTIYGWTILSTTAYSIINGARTALVPVPGNAMVDDSTLFFAGVGGATPVANTAANRRIGAGWIGADLQAGHVTAMDLAFRTNYALNL